MFCCLVLNKGFFLESGDREHRKGFLETCCCAAGECMLLLRSFVKTTSKVCFFLQHSLNAVRGSFGQGPSENGLRQLLTDDQLS